MSCAAWTEAVAAQVHRMFDAGVTPPPPEVAPCRSCSLLPACRPDKRRIEHAGSRMPVDLDGTLVV
jgi:hypothetical protein